MKGLQAMENDEPNPITLRKNGMQISVSRVWWDTRLPITVEYNISTNIVYSIEVIASGTGMQINIKQDNVEIGSRNWQGNLIAIEYPNKDLWAKNPILNDLKLVSLSSETGDSTASINANQFDTKTPVAKKIGNYIVFENTE